MILETMGRLSTFFGIRNHRISGSFLFWLGALSFLSAMAAYFLEIRAAFSEDPRTPGGTTDIGGILCVISVDLESVVLCQATKKAVPGSRNARGDSMFWC